MIIYQFIYGLKNDYLSVIILQKCPAPELTNNEVMFNTTVLKVFLE